MAIALVQSASGTHSGAPEEVTVTLAAPPTPGSLLVARFGVRGTGAALAPTRAGWTVLPTTLAAPSTDGLAVAYRVALAGDPAAMLFGMGAGCSGQNRGTVAEYAMGNAPILDVTQAASGNSNAPSVVVDPTDGGEVLIVAGAAATNSGAPPHYTPQNGETEVDDDICSGGFGPAMWLAHRIIALSAGTYTLGAIITGPGGWAIRATAFRATGGGGAGIFRRYF